MFVKYCDDWGDVNLELCVIPVTVAVLLSADLSLISCDPCLVGGEVLIVVDVAASDTKEVIVDEEGMTVVDVWRTPAGIVSLLISS